MKNTTKHIPKKRQRSKQIKQPIESNLEMPVVIKEEKTMIRQYKGRRFVRFGEVKGKIVSWVELFTSDGDSHSITIRFQDKSALRLGIAPGFFLDTEYYRSKGGEYQLLKRWPPIKSEMVRT